VRSTQRTQPAIYCVAAPVGAVRLSDLLYVILFTTDTLGFLAAFLANNVPILVNFPALSNGQFRIS
jgi:hypothetical protein